MKKCTILIKDEVNVKLEGLDPATRRKCSDKLKFFLPHAYHMPAYKLGRWDGTVRFCDVGGRTYLNLLDDLLPIIMSSGYEIDIDDRREHTTLEFDTINDEFWGDTCWPEGHPAEGEPIRLRDYQVEVVNKFLESPQALQEIATGAGKTIMTATLSKLVEKYGRSIVIVPNKDLVRQTEEDYLNCGLDAGVYFGDRKDIGKTHTICTWQSLNSLLKKTKKGEDNIMDFIEDVSCVIVDEVHQAKADVLKDLLTSVFARVPLRWGLTGTIPKSDHEFATIRASLGDIVNRLAAKDLQDIGVLSNCHVNIVQTQEPQAYTDYQSELKFLLEDKKRQEYLANLIKEISKTGNTLVLTGRINSGQALQELIPEADFVQGAMKSDDRKTAYKEINEGTNSITIATYGVAAVGINIPRIFNMVLLEPGKSFVRVIQSIGRGVRVAKDKDFVQIWDITSRCKFSKRHLTERKKFYKDAEYPFSIEKVKY
ncbi:DEAD/DEAH box helicase family protein [bacterium]|jgi:superfamily II DNA or RNA helicase|nr:DEAD/DEAH box helicase family protein [bacterium]